MLDILPKILNSPRRTAKSRRTLDDPLRPLDRGPSRWRARFETRQGHQQGSL